MLKKYVIPVLFLTIFAITHTMKQNPKNPRKEDYILFLGQQVIEKSKRLRLMRHIEDLSDKLATLRKSRKLNIGTKKIIQKIYSPRVGTPPPREN